MFFFLHWQTSVQLRISVCFFGKVTCKSAYELHGPLRPKVYPRFCSMKRLGVFLLSLDGMLVHHRVIPGIKFTVHLSRDSIKSIWRKEAMWE